LKYKRGGRILNYDLIVTDLDDTLLRNDQTLSERSIRTVKRALEKGIRVAIATGRKYSSALPYAKQLGLTGPMLCCQGAHIADIETGSAIRVKGVPQGLALEAIRFAEERGLFIQYYTTEDYFFERRCEESDYYERTAGVPGVAMGRKLSEALDFEPIKLLVISDPPRIRQVYEEAVAHFGSRLEIAISKSRYMEITHPEVNKGTALDYLMGYLNVPRERVIAVGDALNDLKMIRLAGLGVAVANGDEQVKAQASAVTASNEEDGVALAIEKYALGE
jgi:Cof subfamily protein (haloacid dehalogenase superfamily)